MRFVIAAGVLALALIGPAKADSEAETAFVERSALLAADQRCHLFPDNLHFALEASAMQARRALARGGWSEPDLRSLEAAAARIRACNDPALAAAAQRARAGFASWSRMPSMRFAGDERAWLALRFPDAAGWRLRQDVPTAAVFGVREHDGAEQVSLLAPIGATAQLPPAAQIAMRDPQRGQANFNIPGRLARGLAANGPSPAATQSFWASARRIETIAGQRYMAFVFPDAAFQAMSGLDPREAVEVRLGAAGERGRYLIEVGDLAAARAFLAVR